ncbi:MAG: N-6 DNA methylase, partial [Fibrella sp.]|nr:N-6 DNA methylase [Armatimonadota bacterium]
NGSSLFTGDAGQGESNIRRWILENDWLEAIIALPLNIFYNTGIATYIWVLSNRKPEARRGKTQLIDATTWFKPLRKNLGKKNCELGESDTARILDLFLNFTESEQSKIFPNEAFGYAKITVERPLRLLTMLDADSLERFAVACREQKEETIVPVIREVAASLGDGPHLDYNAFRRTVETASAPHKIKWNSKRWKLVQTALATRDESADPVIRREEKASKTDVPETLYGRYGTDAGTVVEYEPDADLRDTEQVPLLEDGGVPAFFQREVLPYVPDAWIDEAATKIGYEISFTRYFYKPTPLRGLDEIRADIEALEQETEGLLGAILVETGATE